MTSTTPLFFNVDIAAGSSNTVVLWTNTTQSRVKITKIVFQFDYGTSYKVKAAILHGMEQIAPENAMATGDGNKVICDTDVVMDTGDTLYLKYVNDDTTNSYKLLISIQYSKKG